MINDAILLRRYVQERSEAAFRELVHRHLDFTYSVALREVQGNHARAQDITQEVFATLARKAPTLRDRASLAGWLHISTRFAATKLKRSEYRRQRREQEALAMHESSESSTIDRDWARLSPALNDLLRDLSGHDREAVLLRFYRRCPYSEIAATLGLSEGTAQKRVERALERMRKGLLRRGLTSTAGALAALLETNLVTAAPAGLVPVISQGATAAVQFSLGSTLLLQLMSIGKLQVAAFGGILAIGVTLVTLQERRNADLRDELATLRREAEQTATLRAENVLAKKEIETLRAGQVELARLRSDLAAVEAKAVPRAASSATSVPPIRSIDSLRNVGNATAVNALESMIWAKENLDIGVLSKLFTLTPKARQNTERIWERLPLEQRAKLRLSTLEDMLAYFFAGMAKQYSGLQVLEERVIDSETTVLRAGLPRPGGGLDKRAFVFKRSPAGWQWEFPFEAIDEIPNELSKMGEKLAPK